MIQTLGEILCGYKTLFMVDDIIADKNLDKKRQPLLKLAISGRHRDHFVMAVYSVIHCNSIESKETAENDLCLVSKGSTRFQSNQRGERGYRNSRRADGY